MVSHDTPAWESGGGFRFCRYCGLLGLILYLAPLGCRPLSAAEEFTLTGKMIAKQGTVFYARTNQPPVETRPIRALGYHDELRTRQMSWATVKFTDRTEFKMDELTTIRIVPPTSTNRVTTIRQTRGRIYYSNWQQPMQLQVDTLHAFALASGTEFVVSVYEDRTEVLMFEGEVVLRNDVETRRITSGFEAVAAPGEPIVVRPILQAQNIVQWWLYYPGVLDPSELRFADGERSALQESLDHYATGDLVAALESHPAYPNTSVSGSNAAKVYYAAVMLSVGRVDRAETLLTPLPADDAPARALRTLIGAVRLDEVTSDLLPEGEDISELESASLLMARSYWLQSRHRLKDALRAARRATLVSPEFGFAWQRVAELEFGFGRTRVALDALHRAQQFSPRNAQTQALRGFTLSARGRIADALAAFEKAISLNNGLGNAWLGRGLCKIRKADLEGGLADLQTAAVLEPNRALLRSYLAKAFAELEDDAHALNELDYAVELDEADPTPWLYRGLVMKRQNRLNEAVRAFQESVQRNDNRRLFRSRLLLDQDRAVRGANLAGVYRDLGLNQVSDTEASRAVAADYTDASTHRFLADSFDARRDVRQVNLRYESAWLNEWLLANLLGPVGSGSVSQSVSQQEYTRLFERDGAGWFGRTDVRTDGEWQQTGSHYGAFGPVSYAVDFHYHALDGSRPNQDSEQWTLSTQLKAQATERDAVFLQVYGYRLESGDVRQYRDPADADPDLRFSEEQKPTAFLGYHREWSPGQHTLVLGGLLDSRITYREAGAPVPTLRYNPNGTVTSAWLDYEVPDYSSDLDVVSGEVQHLWQANPHTLIIGARVQAGTTDTQTVIERDPLAFPPGILTNGVTQTAEAKLNRVTAYGYYHYQILKPLLLIGGVSYDRLVHPRNIDQPPISDGEESVDQLSPKAGFVWTPAKRTVIRGAYTQSLGGTYYDSSVRLEPSQVAGFVQALRSAIPESVAGAVPGTSFETIGLAIDQRFADSTFVSLQADWLESNGEQRIGVVELGNPLGSAATLSTRRRDLDFRERTLRASVHQLLGDWWTIGAAYRVSQARLRGELVGVPPSPFLQPAAEEESTLHEIELTLRFNHPSGMFGLLGSTWRYQNGEADGSSFQEEFWHHDAWIGYRFAHRRAEIAVGVLNLSDQDYRLSPLNLHADYPRERTLTVSAKFDF